MNELEIYSANDLDLPEAAFTLALKPEKKRGRPKKVNFQEQDLVEDQDTIQHAVSPTEKASSSSSKKGKVKVLLKRDSVLKGTEKKEEKEEKLRYKRIQIDTIFHSFVVNINFLIEKQVQGSSEQFCSCDGKTFRVVKPLLIENLSEVFWLFLSLSDQDLAGVRVFFSLSKNKVFHLDLLEFKKVLGKTWKENDIKLALVDWFKSNSFFTRGNSHLLGVEILLTPAAISHLQTQKISEKYHLRTVYIFSKKDIIVQN